MKKRNDPPTPSKSGGGSGTKRKRGRPRSPESDDPRDVVKECSRCGLVTAHAKFRAQEGKYWRYRLRMVCRVCWSEEMNDKVRRPAPTPVMESAPAPLSAKDQAWAAFVASHGMFSRGGSVLRGRHKGEGQRGNSGRR